MNTIDRNEEIRHSFATGAKAFALGAVLILVVSMMGTPAPWGVDPVVGFDGAATIPSATAPADGRSEANATPPAKFGDIPVNKVAPERGEPEAVPVFVGG